MRHTGLWGDGKNPVVLENMKEANVTLETDRERRKSGQERADKPSQLFHLAKI